MCRVEPLGDLKTLRGKMHILNHARIVRASKLPGLAAAVCLTLAGCQVPPSGPGATLAVDNSDPCQNERAAFAGSKTYFQDQIVSGAVTGAAMGAGMGALTGLAAGGNLKSALIGGLVGGAVGGAAGAGNAYYNTLAERAQDQNELAYNMSQDLARESQQIDHTAVTFAHLRACRYGQARFVKNQARHQEIDRPTAIARIAYHRDKFDEEIRIAREFGLTMAKRGQQFQEAASDLRTRPPVDAQGTPKPRASTSKVAQVDRAASVSVPEKRASYDKTVASAEKSSKAAFDLDSNASLSWLSLNGFDA
jgi:hypothetical protein